MGRNMDIDVDKPKNLSRKVGISLLMIEMNHESDVFNL